jgi:hypothetical protein
LLRIEFSRQIRDRTQRHGPLRFERVFLNRQGCVFTGSFFLGCWIRRSKKYDDFFEFHCDDLSTSLETERLAGVGYGRSAISILLPALMNGLPMQERRPPHLLNRGQTPQIASQSRRGRRPPPKIPAAFTKGMVGVASRGSLSLRVERLVARLSVASGARQTRCCSYVASATNTLVQLEGKGSPAAAWSASTEDFFAGVCCGNLRGTASRNHSDVPNDKVERHVRRCVANVLY